LRTYTILPAFWKLSFSIPTAKITASTSLTAVSILEGEWAATLQLVAGGGPARFTLQQKWQQAPGPARGRGTRDQNTDHCARGSSRIAIAVGINGQAGRPNTSNPRTKTAPPFPQVNDHGRPTQNQRLNHARSDGGAPHGNIHFGTAKGKHPERGKKPPQERTKLSRLGRESLLTRTTTDPYNMQSRALLVAFMLLRGRVGVSLVLGGVYSGYPDSLRGSFGDEPNHSESENTRKDRTGGERGSCRNFLKRTRSPRRQHAR